MTELETLAKNLNELRVEKGLSMREVAERSGLCKSNVVDALNGKRPSFKMLSRLAVALDSNVKVVLVEKKKNG